MLRERGHHWIIRCEAFALSGHDGDHESILKLFLTFVEDATIYGDTYYLILKPPV